MNDDKLRDVERRIRAWSTRPPRLSPKTARTRVLARLDDRRRRPMLRLAAATLTLALLAAVSLMLRPERAAGPPAETPSHRLLVYELESGTKVYLDLAARSAEGKGT